MFSAAALVLAFASVPPSGGPPAADGVLRGIVAAQRSDEPIERVLVVLECSCRPQQLYTLTDADGRYVFRGLSAGRYRLTFMYRATTVEKAVALGDDERLRRDVAIDPEDRGPWFPVRYVGVHWEPTSYLWHELVDRVHERRLMARVARAPRS